MTNDKPIFVATEQEHMAVYALARRGFYYELLKVAENLAHARDLTEGLETTDAREVVACMALPTLLQIGFAKEGLGGYSTDYSGLHLSTGATLKAGTAVAAHRIAQRSLGLDNSLLNNAFVCSTAPEAAYLAEWKNIRRSMINILNMQPSTDPQVRNVTVELCFVALRENLNDGSRNHGGDAYNEGDTQKNKVVK